MIRCLIVAVSLVLLGAMPAFARGEWEIQQFELFDEDKGEPEGAFAWMNEIGVKLKAAGFAQPLIEPLQNNHFRVSVYYFTGDFKRIKGYYVPASCRPGNYLANLNLNRKFVGTKYMTFVFAHEVTHSIQVNSPLMKDCEKIDEIQYPLWIIEGIANAVGFELAEQRWSDFRVTRKVRPQYALGHRDYSRPLDLRDQPQVFKWSEHAGWEEEEDEVTRQTFYMTGSFWSHLVDHYGGLEVIAGILGHKLEPNANVTTAIQWLENALKVEVGPRLIKDKKYFLYHIYPQAVSEIASFGGSRYKSFTLRGKEVSGEDARRKWLNEVYGGHERDGKPCREFWLTRLHPSKEIAITNMGELSSLCLRVDWREMPAGARMFVEAETRSSRAEALADSLHLGTVFIKSGNEKISCHEMSQASPEQCLIKTFVKKRGDEEKNVKHWEIGVTVGEGQNGPDGEYYFNMSNVAPLPWQTLKIGPGQLKVRVGFCMATSGSGLKLTRPQPIGPKLGGDVSVFMGGDQRRIRYGIDQSAFGLGALGDVPGMPSMTGFEFEATSADGSVKRYSIIPSDDTPPGYTGPLNGAVGVDSESIETLVLSTYCNSDRLVRIGQVIRSDDTVLKLSISTDLCEFDPLLQEWRFVEHFEAEITMPFGWRYFHRSAPRDVVTPGMEDYITLFTGAVASHMDSIFSGGTSDGSGGSSNVDDDNDSAGFNIGGDIIGQQSADCDCSCEAVMESLERCEAMDRNDIAAAMTCAKCLSQCTEALIACKKAQAPIDSTEQIAPPVEASATAPVEPSILSVPAGTQAEPVACTCACEAMADESEHPACQQQCGQAWVPCIMSKDFPPPTDAQMTEFRALLLKKGLSAEGIEHYENVFRTSTPAMRGVLLKQYRDK